MSASGQKQPVRNSRFRTLERPLLRKADIQELILKNCLANVRFTPESSRWANMGLKGRL